MENCQIFISYRRAGGEHLAGRIADKLKSLGYQVFLDVVSLKAGKFNEQIYRAIESCKDVLVILSENALDRCKDEGDFVRKEVEYAFSLNKRVIPIMTPGFRFPDILPEKMDEIRYCEGVLTDSHYFHAVIDRIEELIISKPMGGQGYLQFLNLGLYPQVSILCEKAIMENPMDSDAYFYSAVSMLSGKRPFLLDRATIQKIEEYLSIAITLRNDAVYHYFLAYIKLDYYHRKMLRAVPDYRTELQQALELSITEEEVTALFKLLRTSRPAEL